MAGVLSGSSGKLAYSCTSSSCWSPEKFPTVCSSSCTCCTANKLQPKHAGTVLHLMCLGYACANYIEFSKHTHVSAKENLPSAATHASSAAVLSVALNPCIQISCLQTARTHDKTCHPTSLACKAGLSVATTNSSVALSARMTPHTHTAVLAMLDILLFPALSHDPQHSAAWRSSEATLLS